MDEIKALQDAIAIVKNARVDATGEPYCIWLKLYNIGEYLVKQMKGCEGYAQIEKILACE